MFVNGRRCSTHDLQPFPVRAVQLRVNTSVARVSLGACWQAIVNRIYELSSSVGWWNQDRLTLQMSHVTGDAPAFAVTIAPLCVLHLNSAEVYCPIIIIVIVSVIAVVVTVAINGMIIIVSVVAYLHHPNCRIHRLSDSCRHCDLQRVSAWLAALRGSGLQSAAHKTTLDRERGRAGAG
jgi:hypothetical protein